MNASQDQHGGDHYKRMAVSPWDVVDTWPLAERIGFYRGNLLKYTMRLHDKDAPADNVGKAKHYAAKLAEVLAEPAPICPGSKTPCHSNPCPAQDTCAERYGVQPDIDGWLPWSGGECPVPEGTMGFIRRSDGYESKYPGDLSLCLWSAGGPHSIIAYRVAK